MDENVFYRIEVTPSHYATSLVYAAFGVLAVLALWQVTYVHSLFLKSYMSSSILVAIFIHFNHLTPSNQPSYILHLSEQGKLICPKLGLSGNVSRWSYHIPFWIFLRIDSDVKQTRGSLSLCTMQLNQQDQRRFFRIIRRLKKA